MKFLPPEEEIRAQLRELTSQTRRLRADLQGLINDRGHSDSPLSRRRNRRLPAREVSGEPRDDDVPVPRPSEARPSQPRKPAKRR